MFLLDDGGLVLSPSDLANAAACELAVLSNLDGRLGWSEPVPIAADAMLERVSALGSAHEDRVLRSYRASHPVVTIARPRYDEAGERAALERVHAATLEALSSGADVVYQAGFFDGRFTGWADFLVREDGRWSVLDTKLARSVKVTALLQLAAYADQLIRSGVPVTDEVHLVLGDRSRSSHRLADLLPLYRERRARLEQVLDEHRAGGRPVTWGDARYRACGRCDACAAQVAAHRDVLLVAGLRSTQRARLAAAGVRTIDQLAAGTDPVPGIGGATLANLRRQAALQVRQETSSEPLVFEVVDPVAVADLPAPDPGDIFFDFEGDPLWTDDSASADEPADWGLEYLFGVVEADGAFRPFWAHDRAQEKRAFVDFLAYVAERRAAHPGMHVYHYAPYERTALLRLAGRHGVGEDQVDQLLRDGVLVDLYATVRRGLRVGAASYSLKKLEPLYMGDQTREGDVTTATDSITEYAEACDLRDAGNDTQWRKKLDEIAGYNRYDCVSTLRLRDWLLDHGPAPTGSVAADLREPEPVDPLVADVLAKAERLEHPRDQQAVRLLAAAVDYHTREAKPFWWAHFDRLQSDPAEWLDPRGTLLVDGSPEVVEDWNIGPGKQTFGRVLRVAGHLEPGSDLRVGGKAYALYDPPPAYAQTSSTGHRGWTQNVEVLGVTTQHASDSASGTRDVLRIVERLRKGEVPAPGLPMALAPTPGPQTTGIEAAIRVLAEAVADGLPALPDLPAVDLLRRIPPRTRTLALPRPDDVTGTTEAIIAAVLDLDGSYLAVQGPPGTGKTYTGGHVVAALAAQGWKVGVVAQSHAVVENMLRAVNDAGLAPEQIGKKAQDQHPDDAVWESLPDGRRARAFHDRQPGGFVVGGTKWDFTSGDRIPSGGFDLLVIDEAGQFSLADTIAVSTAARNLLLLGDPQQLPQVTQGRHPEPVDLSALGWLVDGHDTLPDELGYFLARTWRMHPALCAAVSRLSYEDRLTAVPRTAQRSLDGVEPGLRTVAVDHVGNAVSSPEEAAVVVDEIRALLGRDWTDGTARPLTGQDVLVVAPYNAQVWTVRRALEAAGIPDVRVGTVDKFQGQEAAVVLVTTCASSADEVPRGMEFLLNRNRLNVAVSRAQWCAVIVRSTRLTDYLPTRPETLAELGAFIGLCDADGRERHGSRSGRS
ncbi:TM0106 family RecB-like putative nuclease [Cellulomonas fengjieae]|uniref:TM0106 family RecB-like putative nuclease n=1 Tax=Cellulomonas fengjieae TaxID=2819978 RepID=UPI001AAE6BA5|nr:bifunctional RecB family nuclease/DEAD/DEAH box helicase [Cellulomonas fengjieae]MBO3101002.1 TM0106 family RecB-like putative nuclease [Cellulomonas fengjieae]